MASPFISCFERKKTWKLFMIRLHEMTETPGSFLRSNKSFQGFACLFIIVYNKSFKSNRWVILSCCFAGYSFICKLLIHKYRKKYA